MSELTLDAWQKAQRLAASRVNTQQDPTDASRRPIPVPAPTRAEDQASRIAAARHAWASTRERVQDWPADLAARELQRVADNFGAEPGTTSAVARLAETVVLIDPAEGPARSDVDKATGALVASLRVQLTE